MSTLFLRFFDTRCYNISHSSMKIMLKSYAIVIIFIFAVLTAAFTVSLASGENLFFLFSPAFNSGARIPHKYANRQIGGENISIPLFWKYAPTGTKSFAVSMIDMSASGFKHWTVIYIPASVMSIGEGKSGVGMPKGSRELKNDFDSEGYGGPAPPKNTGVHNYVVTVYALKRDPLDVPDDISYGAFTGLIQKFTIAKASITGKMEQK